MRSASISRRMASFASTFSRAGGPPRHPLAPPACSESRRLSPHDGPIWICVSSFAEGVRCGTRDAIIVESGAATTVHAVRPTRVVHVGAASPDLPNGGVLGAPTPEEHTVHVVTSRSVRVRRRNRRACDLVRGRDVSDVSNPALQGHAAAGVPGGRVRANVQARRSSGARARSRSRRSHRRRRRLTPTGQRILTQTGVRWSATYDVASATASSRFA